MDMDTIARPHQFVERFWKAVKITPACWEWTGKTLATGYGYLCADITGSHRYKRVLAPRAAYLLAYQMLPDEMHVHHLCCNQRCVRPSHLYLAVEPEDLAAMRANGNYAGDFRHIAPRFWQKVRKTDTCWLWTGPVNPGGYGHAYFDGIRDMAHRMSWQIVNGPIQPGLWVLHRCDVRLCVRPDHLFLGTCKDNMRDCVAKGRISTKARGVKIIATMGPNHWTARDPDHVPRGEQRPNAKMTDEKVRSMRRQYLTGAYRMSDLAEMYGIERRTVSNILRHQTWRHVND